MVNDYAVLHLQKCKPNVHALGRHILREHTPPNADPERLSLNRILVHPGPGKSLTTAINERIAQGYKGKKKLRSDAVKAINIVLTGSHEGMKRIEELGRIDEWAEANRAWLERRYGKENLVSLTLHMDERTPHLHAVVVPLTSDGRLSAKEVVGNKYDLQRLQDDYAEQMRRYNLDRGVRGSKARHTDVKEYYRTLAMSDDLLTHLKLQNPQVNLKRGIEKIKALETLYINEIIKMKQFRGDFKAISPKVASRDEKNENNQKKGPEIDFGI
jgi:hypothetical protein